MTRDLAPCSRGFDKSFTYLPGSGNHHAWEPQFQEGVKMKAPSMWMHKFWMEGDQFIDTSKDLPDDFYSTTSFTDRLLAYLGSRDEAEKEKPFFSYLAFTAPHWPLQAPRHVVDKYKGMYDDGPDELTKKRLARMKKLGLIRPDVECAPPLDMGKDWDDMTPEERKYSARKMEVFAGMVDMIDQNLGRVVDYLEETGELDNTFILFMSDNGAEGVALEAIPVSRALPLSLAPSELLLSVAGHRDQMVFTQRNV